MAKLSLKEMSTLKHMKYVYIEISVMCLVILSIDMHVTQGGFFLLTWWRKRFNQGARKLVRG